MPTLKSLKEESHRAYISVDKLYVDGELYTGKLVQPQDQSSNGDQRPGVARGAMRGRGHGYGQGHGQGRGWGSRYEVLSSRDGSQPGHSRSSSVENGRAQDGQGHNNEARVKVRWKPSNMLRAKVRANSWNNLVNRRRTDMRVKLNF